ncbi:MAG: SAM-dependent methyltransferase [Nitrospirae bacterium]|nr:SAM-dependent methyltransferase [Nitrospirota bacterium]
MTDAGNTLRALIADEIARAGGAIPFRRYMELALYAPGVGYYTGPRGKIGRDGDFFTSLDVHPVFGRLLATQVIEMSRALPDGPFTVVEMGAGKGHLAHDVLRTVEAADPALFARLRYVIVDVSEDLIARQKKLLAAYGARIEWAADLGALSGVRGVFLSNELVDSLPHHQVVMTGDGLREVYVGEKDGRFREGWGPPSTPALAAYFDAIGITLPKGYRTEVNLAALDWMRAVGGALERGFVITIDYGYPADVYYQADRRRGTFLCFHEHKASENPYVRVGRQDMTAHVDFSSLARAGTRVGLEAVGLTDQAHFLVGLGITHAMEAVLACDGGDPRDSDEFRAMRRLMDPHGMGKAFKVLVQRKGVGHAPLAGMAMPAFHITDLLGVD